MNGEYKILIIDDEEVVLDSCTEILAGSGYKVATAANGSEGLLILKDFEPDLVFVDLKMPGISGLEVLEEIFSSNPTIVTIVITGYATVSSAVEAMKQGAYDFLPKPFTPDEFRLITKRGLEKRSLVLETIALRKEKEMLRENFAAIVSHELKSPLGAVQQNLYTLIDEIADNITEDQLRRLKRMKTRTAELVELINTWLRVISVNIDSIKEQFHPISVDKIVNNAIESVQPHAIRKNIEIVATINEQLSSVNGDDVTLTESLVNILTNAIKFSHMGNKINVTAEQTNRHIIIKITDYGIGISTEDLPYIFNDFYSGSSDQSKEKGSGIGLAVSRRIVEAHDGSISVESELGEGSTFNITLPVFENDLS
jgi:signal transduction histidine kinase